MTWPPESYADMTSDMADGMNDLPSDEAFTRKTWEEIFEVIMSILKANG